MIIENSTRRANGCTPISVDIPCEAQTRSEIPPAFVHAGPGREARIAIEEQARRRVGEAVGMNAGSQRSFVEMNRGAVVVGLREERLPAYTVTHRYPLCELPRIGEVRVDVVGMVMLFDRASVSP